MIDLSVLNTEQSKAVKHINGPIIVLAGAGTGKTRVITYRIAYLLSKDIKGEEIVALTFTNKAAREMYERVQSLLGKSKPSGIFIGTFHSFCLKILKQFYKEVGLHPHFSIFSTADQLDLTRKALEESGTHKLLKPEDIHYLITKCKEKLLTPELVLNLKPNEFSDFKFDFDIEYLSLVYQKYERLLKLNRAVDFEDLILKTVLLLKNDEQIKAKLNQKWKYYLVDEFQDTNFSQFAVLNELTDHNKNICVVGDDDQSIYGWRGAISGTFSKFSSNFEHSEMIKLEQNYRSTNIVLKAANALIKNNTQRVHKDLWSKSELISPITSCVLDTDLGEAQWVGRKCLTLLGRGYRLKDIGILYRTNSHARYFESTFREMKLTYKTFGGMSFFERREVKDFFSYIRFIVSPHNHLLFWKIINVPARGVGLKTMEKIEEVALKEKISPFEVIEKKLDSIDVSKRTKESIIDFIEKINSLSSMKLEISEDVETLGTQIIKDFKLEQHIQDISANDGSLYRRVELLKSLPTWLSSISKSVFSKDQKASLRDVLDSLFLDERDEDSSEDERDDFISLMTIHAAKGLEFKIVFLCGLEDGHLPHKNNISDLKKLEEERRLFYVAITRARELLYLSHSPEKYGVRNIEFKLPSRFLNELPKNLVIEDDESIGTKAVHNNNIKKDFIGTLKKIREGLS